MAEAKKKTESKTTESQTEETVDLSDEKTPSSDPKVQEQLATGGGRPTGILGGPSQDDLKPAYARPKDPEHEKDNSPNQVDPPAPN